MKKITIAVLASTLIILASIAPAFATPANTTSGITPYGMSYSQVTGRLGDADYIIQIPDAWNGMLVIACPWYQYPPGPTSALSHLKYDPIAQVLLTEGYAFASCNYGGSGWPITEAMTSIHQLTEYVVGKYDVTGKVFLIGGSMGGCVAILLGEKYPQLYSGVLDLCGAKDLVSTFNNCVWAATHSLDEIRVARGMPPSTPDATVQGFKDFCTSIMNDVSAETGGTPDNKPQVYAKIDPNQQTAIKIPIISVYGQLDPICPPSTIMTYHAALAAAGTADLHRYYIVPNGAHIDAAIFASVPGRLAELVAWSDSLD